MQQTREAWADSFNRALEAHGIGERVSHLSLERQLEHAIAAGGFERAAEVDRLPGVHLGPHAAALERKGIATDLGDELRAVVEENAARAAAYEAIRELAADVPEAPARFLAMRQETGDPVATFEAWGEWAMAALERVAELAREIMEPVREMAAVAVKMVADVADWFTGLAQVDDAGLREAREEIREREVAAEEREIADLVAARCAGAGA